MSAAPDWASLRRKLQSLIERVGEEIRAYPAPIPACDAQFNYLLELRRLLPHELERLEAAARDPAASAEDFVRSSPCSEQLVDAGIPAPPAPVVR